MEKVLIKLNGTQNFLNGEINQIELTTEGTIEIKDDGNGNCVDYDRIGTIYTTPTIADIRI